jgi:signal transduction histidine kinase
MVLVSDSARKLIVQDGIFSIGKKTAKLYLSKISITCRYLLRALLSFLSPSADIPGRYQKQVLITNIFSFIFFWVTLGIVGIFYSLFGYIDTLPFIFLVAVLFLAIPFVNSHVNYRIGRLAFCLIPVWLTFFVTIYFKLHAGENLTPIVFFDSRFILMATVILPGIVFRLEERTLLIISLGSTTIFLLLYDPIHELFGAGYFQLGFVDRSYQYINYIVSVTYVTLLFGVLLMRSVLERSEKGFVNQNHDLIEKQNEIEAQTEELLQQQEEMQASSEKLEQANRLILKQQEALSRYNKQLEELVAEKSADLVKTNEELVKHNNELLQFSYTVSHNLRGPVARMIGLTRLLRHPDAIEDQQRLQELILKSSEELDEILKDLSLIIDIRNDLYRIREKLYLEEEWQKAANLLGEGVKSVYQLDIDFSEAPYIFGVRPMIQSIFYNLFSNAIKYQSPDRKLRVKVSSEVLSDNRKVIRISDNGLGIDLEHQRQNLFKLYKRFHPHVPGKGLGLYLVKTQVEALNGEIIVESEIDRGTMFTLIFSEPEEVTRQVFYDTDAVQLYYDGNLNIIVISWKRQITTEEYHHAFECLLNSLNKYQSPGLIADIRKQGVLAEQDQIWFTKSILPHLMNGSCRKIAVIGLDAPERSSYFNKVLALSRLVKFDLRVFPSVEASLGWIEAAVSESVTVRSN